MTFVAQAVTAPTGSGPVVRSAPTGPGGPTRTGDVRMAPCVRPLI